MRSSRVAPQLRRAGRAAKVVSAPAARRRRWWGMTQASARRPTAASVGVHGRCPQATPLFGTPQFIVGQTLLVAVWIALDVIALRLRWDPYPFILLNLAFSTQAAYAACSGADRRDPHAMTCAPRPAPEPMAPS